MGMAGLMFEPRPPNFENFHNFKDVQMMLKQFFDISTGFRFSKLQWFSVPSIPVAVLELAYIYVSLLLNVLQIKYYFGANQLVLYDFLMLINWMVRTEK